MIDGVFVKNLKLNCDERGRLMEIFRCDDEGFDRFGQVYMTTAYPGVVKAWHYHKKQADHFVCLKGMMKLVLYDSRPKSRTKGAVQEFFLGDFNSILVKIPPGIYHGFKCVSEDEAIVINIPDFPYNRKSPDEFRLPAHTKKIPYEWARKDG
ncbi:dTDP-4-dehydrorhamnose 3,5-epimerase family protein [bacterium]|nr:dTDP-4-dehydrorhamnose 3,5-epimerase family protein [bacterium]